MQEMHEGMAEILDLRDKSRGIVGRWRRWRAMR